ncbi:disease resistance-like protein DSC1 [Ziziphus jujuba]|uniref:ADP-ribosyl cyclase/cyclic ADP-ribose hydrolase n=1 Tax=Ziziphus jujuba TaxID=326968 RepID=A0ABM4AB14_ZIZJJ|nr:disease resistance-like protein DSC1 [Ziziphus jujuba]
MASSSLSLKHDVFLSFRGEDTRNTFVGYLYAALSANQILTFMDHELERGDEISPTLSRAIKESKISVIIFSENYASSTWCLDELVHILEYKKTRGQIVIPIFYGIDPSVVRKQEGSYKVAFDSHEKSFRDRMEKVNQWKAALTEASNLCGLDSKDFRPENRLVQKIVEDISLKLPKYLLLDEHIKGHLIGIEKHIKEIEWLLSNGTKAVRIIGCCFLWNVREEYARFGLHHLRRKLLSNLLNVEANVKMDTLDVTSPFNLDRLRRKKVLIVLDDVDSSIQLDALVEGYRQLACGSRIVVSTRNKQVLMKEADYIYKLERLNPIESLKLFHLHAFGKNSTAVDDKMVLEVTNYANGNPLALKVLGSFLCSRSKNDWESALKKLKRFPNLEIQDVLRISYEGLDDKRIKDTFLDVACLFDSSFTRDHAESILDDGNSSIKIEISVLIEKCLIEDIGSHMYRNDELLWMHDLLRQMGRAIVRDEDREPGNRSRLCDAMEIGEVLENSTGTKAVEIISFNMFEIKKNVKVCHEAFSNMRNLRILKVYCRDDAYVGNKFKLSIPQDLDSYLSNKLRSFQWDFYPLKSLPSNFIPENLVELVLHCSHVEKLWNSRKVQYLPVLRRIDLSCSKFLSQLPDLSQAPNLESIDLEGCTSLVQVLLSLQNLDKLTYLNLNGCSKLRDFQDISKRTEGCLDVVRFGGIKNVLNNFTYLKSCIQSFTGNLFLYSSQVHISQKFAPNLRYLILSGTAIETVPPSLGYLPGLVELDMEHCKRLRSLPTSICHLKSLETLYLCGCEKLKTFPEILEPMEHLTELWLDYSGIKGLPESIENIVSLRKLYIQHCKDFEFLPDNLCKLRNLERIWLDNCSKFQNLPSLPSSLLELSLLYCERLKSLPEIPSQCLSLKARGCTSLENISTLRAPLLHDLDIIRNRNCFDYIDFYGCEKLDQNTRNSVLADHAVIKILSRLIFVNTDPNVVLPSVHVFRYPGDEIPKWFSYQTCGSSINNIMLPPYWNNDDFLGLAFCKVLRQNKIDKNISFGFNCELNFKTIDDDRLYRYHDYAGRLSEKKAVSSDHVVLWYVAKSTLRSSKWNMESCRELDRLNWPSTCSTEASFHIWPSLNNNGNKYCEIKKLGVRFVYKEDLERCDAETERKNKRRFYEYCESSGSEAVGSCEEEVNDESHSKKLKFM